LSYDISIPMLDYLPQIIIVALLAAGVWLLLQPRYEFLVRIERAAPRIDQGSVAPEFLQAIDQVCREHDIHTGWVGGVRRRRRVSLVFSPQFPASAQQRLRNAWTLG
jgi:hypothetical protein